jgi:hypothetical protein
MTQWLMPLYKWVGASYPKASLVVVCLIGALIVGGMWFLTGREYQEKNGAPDSASAIPSQASKAEPHAKVFVPTTPSAPLDDYEKNILLPIISKYQNEHNGQAPSADWVN